MSAPDLNIDRIVLANVTLSPRDADSFRGQVATELERLVTERGLPEAANADALVVPLAKSGALATNVASAIYDALGNAR
ncbi:MAG: hypothetical protein QOE68_3933 [Thermoanaerobaculia bacterium]|jgi:hypothetical protein|nr:hypothetical protein [Thermoanaerobaculia bacterium]